MGEAILSVRLLLHAITAWSVVSYVSQHRRRWGPTLLAILILGCSLAAFFQGVTEWRRITFNTQPWVMGLVLALAIICVASRGNLARPLNLLFR